MRRLPVCVRAGAEAGPHLSRVGHRGTLRDLTAILFCGGMLLLPGISSVDLFNPDEPREAEIAREMRASGDLLVPRFNGCPFLEKPPLFYWLGLGASGIPGLGPEAAARLPSVLAGLGLLLVVYLLGRELYDRRTGRAGALLLLTTFQFWWLARRALLDMTLAALVAAAMLFFLLGHRRAASRRRWFALAGAACAGAVLTKGLIGLLIPALAAMAYLAWRRELRTLFSPSLMAAAALPLAALGLWVLLLALRPDGACYVREFLVENHLKRFAGAGYGGHRQPVWYYLESLATDFQPWVLFLPGSLIALWPGLRRRTSDPAQLRETPSGKDAPGHSRPDAAANETALAGRLHHEDRRGGEAFLHAWLLPALLVLSAASSKRSLYLLPVAAPAALLVAAWWRRRRKRTADRGDGPGPRPERMPNGRGDRTSLRGSRGSIRPTRWRVDLGVALPGGILALEGILIACALPVAIGALLTGLDPGKLGTAVSVVIREPSGIPAGVGFLLAVVAIAAVAARDRRRGARATVLLAGTLYLIGGAVLLPLASPRLSARSLGEVLRAERDRGARVAAHRITEGSLGQFLFYSRGTVEWIGRRSRGPESACTDCRLATSAGEFLLGAGPSDPRACLLLQADLETLPDAARGARVLARKRIGGASYALVRAP